MLDAISIPLIFMGLIASIDLLMDRGGLTVKEKRQSFAVLTTGALLGLFMTEMVMMLRNPDMVMVDKIKGFLKILIPGIFTGFIPIPLVSSSLLPYFLL